MNSIEPILAAHPFFKEFERRHFDIILGCSENVQFEAGQFIFREGQDADSFYLLYYGKISLEVFVPQRGTIPIQTLKAGEVLGWSWMIPPYHWHFDARAVELTRAVALNGVCLRKRCDEDHDLGYRFLTRIAHIMEHRLQATRIQLLDLYGKHT
jgi:CRP/FNR family cyclic AMP-dependent transcriptional regulator